MPEQTGSHSNMRIDCSRCLPIRYDESACRRCVEICPHNAITITEQLRIDPERCRGCLLCSTVCPSGALEMNHDFAACRAALARVGNPVLGCCRTAENANATLPCLGGLSEEHLLALQLNLNGTLTLLINSCNGCPNNTMLPLLLERIQLISKGGMDQEGCRIVTADAGTNVSLQHEQLDRRSFFSSFRTALFQGAAAVMNSATEPVEQCCSYGDKRLPKRRELLNQTISQLSADQQERISRPFTHQITFSSDCSACQGCVAICPTGALTTTDRAQHPAFKQDHCTGCGLCVEFCLDQAISL